MGVEITAEFVKSCFRARGESSHKGDYGHTAVVSGSGRYPGAAALCSRAASRVGSGLVTLCSTGRVCESVSRKNSETIFLRLEETPGGTISAGSAARALALKPSAFVVGCGLASDADTASLVKNLISAARCPMVLDADGLNAAAGDKSVLSSRKGELVLTPHAGEMSMLTGESVGGSAGARERVASRFAREHSATVVLKGHNTVVASPDGELLINTTGNPGMAKGGSGDILAGMIGGLLAQGMSAVQAAACGVFIHGLAGDIAALAYTQWAMLPDDTLNMIPEAFKKVLG